jgi:AraC family cel operon transcriptional repressor
MENVIDVESETHYAYHTWIDEAQYPQVHDFYELCLITQGKINFVLNSQSLTVEEGNLLFIRPGDIHSKRAIGESAHINLAFPETTISSLFVYLYDDAVQKDLLKLDRVPVCRLSIHDANELQNKLIQLNLISIKAKNKIKVTLRTLLAEIVSQYIIPAIKEKNEENSIILPLWLEQALYKVRNSNDYSGGIDSLIKYTNKSPEHLCRIFKKYFHLTPTAYMNEIRLTYAANLLAHSDIKIIDVAFKAGFQSLSYFHHIFKREFGLTPHKFRNSSFKKIG